MKIYKLLVLFFWVTFGWSCVESGLELGEEIPLVSEMSLDYGEIRVSDLLVENSPLEFQSATAHILIYELGYKLLKRIKAFNPKGPFIHFAILPNVAQDVLTMGYAGNWKIYYTEEALDQVYCENLLFHEFFHIFQYENNPSAKNRNSELEAYLAQYIYIENKCQSTFVPVLDSEFHKKIQKLAGNIDKTTGKLKANVDLEQFYVDYKSALEFLENYPLYSGEDWYSNNNYRVEYPFQ